jgi:hypothetical protein
VPRERARAPWQGARSAAPAGGGDDFRARLLALVAELDTGILRAARAELEQARAGLAQASSDLLQARSELAEVQAQAAHWRGAAEALWASRSWRVTAPLRRAATWLGRP